MAVQQLRFVDVVQPPRLRHLAIVLGLSKQDRGAQTLLSHVLTHVLNYLFRGSLTGLSSPTIVKYLRG